jgi:hypothetical protein
MSSGLPLPQTTATVTVAATVTVTATATALTAAVQPEKSLSRSALSPAAKSQTPFCHLAVLQASKLLSHTHLLP